MKEISNATLAMLVVAAIVVSVFGTLISLNKLNQIGGPGILTGMVSRESNGTGRANLTVPASAFINVSDQLIDLGVIPTGQTNSSDLVNDWWVVQNDGSVRIDIKIYNHSSSAGQGNEGKGPFSATLTGGCFQSGTSTCFLVKCKNSSSDSYSFCNTTYGPLNMYPTEAAIITNLSHFDGNDTAYFGVNATVPDNELPGQKIQWVEFLAAATP